jgi:hypothetical protein
MHQFGTTDGSAAPAAATQSAVPPASLAALSKELTPQQLQQIQQMTAVPAPLPSTPDPAEANILANAGQDAPSLLPPEVMPQASGLTATAATLGGPASAVASPAQTAASTANSAPLTSTVNTSVPPQSANVSQDNATAASASTNATSSAPSLNGSIKLELEGINPTPTSVKLKVVLKNDGSQALTIPTAPTALVRMFGQSDQKAQVIFTDKQVAAGGAIHGVIKVAGHNLNPAADLVLPGFLPAAFADRDVHLTVPISALIK